MKVCTYKECETPVELQEFGKNKLAKDGLQRICKDCKRKADAKYRNTSKGKETKKKNSQSDKAKEYRKEYYAKDEVKSRMTEYKSSEEYKKQQREYATQKHRKEAQKVFQQSEKYKETRARYKESQAYKESKKVSEGKRRANKTSAVGIIDKEYLENLKSVQDYKCFHCSKELNFTDTTSVHLDHYIPLSKGGMHCISNLVWSCSFCNISKKDKMPDTPLTFKIASL